MPKTAHVPFWVRDGSCGEPQQGDVPNAFAIDFRDLLKKLHHAIHAIIDRRHGFVPTKFQGHQLSMQLDGG